MGIGRLRLDQRVPPECCQLQNSLPQCSGVVTYAAGPKRENMPCLCTQRRAGRQASVADAKWKDSLVQPAPSRKIGQCQQHFFSLASFSSSLLSSTASFLMSLKNTSAPFNKTESFMFKTVRIDRAGFSIAYMKEKEKIKSNRIS